MNYKQLYMVFTFFSLGFAHAADRSAPTPSTLPRPDFTPANIVPRRAGALMPPPAPHPVRRLTRQGAVAGADAIGGGDTNCN